MVFFCLVINGDQFRGRSRGGMVMDYSCFSKPWVRSFAANKLLGHPGAGLGDQDQA